MFITGSNYVVRFDNTGKLVGTFVPAGSGGLQYAMYPVFGPDGNLYVDDWTLDSVLRYNGSTGAFMGDFVTSGSGGLRQPSGMVFGPEGNLYVISYGMRAVVKYNGTTGASMGVFTSGGAMVAPYGIAFGPDGNLYIADEVNVLKYNGASGTYMGIFVPAGSGGLSGPVSLVFRPDGYLYVTGQHSGVQRYNGTTGAFVDTFVPNTGQQDQLAFGPDGNLYLGISTEDIYTPIYRYNGQTGAFMGVFIQPGSAGGIRGFTFSPGAAPPLQSQVLPNHGGNAGMATVQVIGAGFQGGASVRLTGIGSDIIGTNADVPNALVLTTTFNLTGAAPGVRNVVVTNLDGTSATLTGGFTVEQGGAPQISVNIIGRDKIRIGTAQTYYVAVSNTGSVDSTPGIASLTLPSFVGYTLLNGSELFIAGTTNDPDYQVPAPFTTATSASSQNVNLLFATPSVAAGGTQIAPLQLTLPSTAPSSIVAKAIWQQNITDLSVDDVLAFKGIPFLSLQTSCGQCANEYLAELQRWHDVSQAYLTLQTTVDNLRLARVNVYASIGIVATTALLASTLGMPPIGGVVLGALASQTLSCAQNDFTAVSGQSCLISLQSIYYTLLNADTALFRLGLSPSLSRIAGALAYDVKIALAAINAAGGVVDAYGAEQAALGAFNQALGPYTIARSTYQACTTQPANAATCGVVSSTQPPDLPGTSTLTVQGVSSLDPNDKVGPTGIGAGRFTPGESSTAYSLYFENQPTATAPAQSVTITDPLNANFNLNTVTLGPISFPNQVVTPPSIPLSVAPFATTLDLRPTTNLLVKVSASLNASTGVLTWSLQSLDPSTNQPPTDPLAGFLPPGAEGSVFFTVLPKSGTNTGTVIQNSATVVFDNNPPINTPTWSNTIDNTKPTSHVAALPTTETTYAFPVQWSGSDVGAGVQDFTVFVSDNGGAFTVWLTNTTATQTTYTGLAGHTYSFYSIARDLVGNVEDGKTSADAGTRVAPPPAATTISVTPATASVPANKTQQFTATAYDQYGNPMSPQPAIGWSVSGGGSINGGLFTAGPTAGGPFTVTASVSGSTVTGTATLVIAACTVTAAPSSPAVPGTAGTLTLTLNGGSCGWTASSNVPWLTPAATSGTGSTLNVSVAANSTGALRSGTITVNSQTVIVTQAANNPGPGPGLVSLSPYQGSGPNATLTLVYAHPNGWAAIRSAEFIMNPRWESTQRSGGCHVKYAPGTNVFTLIADDGNSVGGTTTPGSAANISNSQCALNAASSSASGNGNNLTVVVALTFSAGFTGQRHIWMQAVDYNNLSTNWLVYGVWFPTQTSVTAGPWYRIYDPFSNSYLYSADPNEYATLGARGFVQQGISGLAMNGPTTVGGTTNIAWYRVYVNSTSSHFWTSDRNEFLTLINQQQAYVGEGVAAFVVPYLTPQGQFLPQPPNMVPFWRAAYQGANLHFWTSDANEYNGTNGKQLPAGYKGEGIACYIFPATGAVGVGTSAQFDTAMAAPSVDGGEPAVVSAVNGASYVSNGVIAPGQVLSIYGRHLGGRVLMNGVPAQVTASQDNEIRVVAPYDLAPGTEATLEVEHQGRRSKRVTMSVVASDPAIFGTSQYGTGIAQARNEDGTTHGSEHPAARGSVVTLYTTGVGLTDMTVEVHIGGQPAEVVSTQVSGTRPGVIEVQVRVPETVQPAPFQPVVLHVGNLFSQPGVGLAIQ
jgi:uncharacterized protein (TIGR03437 family)